MRTKKQIIIIGVLCVIALGLGYWSGMPEEDSGQRAGLVAPTVVTNVVTNTLKEVVTNTVMMPQPIQMNRIIQDRIVNKLVKADPTKADYEKVTSLEVVNRSLTNLEGLEMLTQLEKLNLKSNNLTDVKGLEGLNKLKMLTVSFNRLTDVKGLEKLTQLEGLNLYKNNLTNVIGLEKLTQLKVLDLSYNPALTEAQIDELQKALPNCRIHSNPTK